mmetsp:Transcript_39977/g.105999  ORF Transcript_39977/g.105999 Transcript_39977/m.105999 type:complete len:205 (-) Transcript_39977:232-846(-)
MRDDLGMISADHAWPGADGPVKLEAVRPGALVHAGKLPGIPLQVNHLNTREPPAPLLALESPRRRDRQAAALGTPGGVACSGRGSSGARARVRGLGGWDAFDPEVLARAGLRVAIAEEHAAPAVHALSISSIARGRLVVDPRAPEHVVAPLEALVQREGGPACVPIAATSLRVFLIILIETEARQTTPKPSPTGDHPQCASRCK